MVWACWGGFPDPKRPFREIPNQLEMVAMKYLELQTTSLKWMFGETTIFHVKILNRPVETTVYKWMFKVPGICHIRLLTYVSNAFRAP